MDAGIADTLNRQDAKRIAARLDQADESILDGMLLSTPWYRTAIADTFMGDTSARAWVVGQITTNLPGLYFDGEPADGDWDNLFSHLRAEIEARRDPETPPVRDQPLREMV